MHSFRFLKQIRWTKELKNIPEIARAHHEKLDGSGYPYDMKGRRHSLPVQDDGHRGYLRRPHGSRPALQARRAH